MCDTTKDQHVCKQVFAFSKLIGNLQLMHSNACEVVSFDKLIIPEYKMQTENIIFVCANESHQYLLYNMLM